MEVSFLASPSSCLTRTLRFPFLLFQVYMGYVHLVLLCFQVLCVHSHDHQFQREGAARGCESLVTHSCIHDQIIEQRKRPGRKVYSVTPQVYEQHGVSNSLPHQGRALLGVPELHEQQQSGKQSIRIFLNYDAVGHSSDRDCRKVGDIAKLGEPPFTSYVGTPTCNPHGDPPIHGDCWCNCALDDIAGEDKRQCLRKALEQTADWFGRALSVEPVKGNLQLGGYSACGQDGGVPLPPQIR